MTNHSNEDDIAGGAAQSGRNPSFDKRMRSLEEKLDKVHADKAAKDEAEDDARLHARGMAYGLRMATELVAAIIVGGLIGYALDQWLQTTPWLFLLFFAIGFAAGVRNVWRGFVRLQAEIAAKTGGNIGHAVPDDDDD